MCLFIHEQVSSFHPVQNGVRGWTPKVEIEKGIRPNKEKEFNMLKIRLKRLGAKKAPTYRVIVINSTTKREGKPIEELGYYNPKTKDMKLNKASAEAWISKGAQPTDTVKYLIANCNADGSLNYKKSETVKLSKKAIAKKAAEEEAKKAEEEAKKAAEAAKAAEAEEAAPAEEAQPEA